MGMSGGRRAGVKQRGLGTQWASGNGTRLVKPGLGTSVPAGIPGTR